MRTDRHKLKTLCSLAGTITSALCLAACGGGGSKAISVAALKKCAHASSASVPVASSDTYLRTVIAKTVKGGSLEQRSELTSSDEAELLKQEMTTRFSLYVFADTKTATEAFHLISSSPNATNEYGAGGSFQRGNIIINSASQESSGSLTALAETLLNKCAGAGATESILRPQESQNTTGENTGQSTTDETSPSQEGTPDEPSQGQSPVPGEG